MSLSSPIDFSMRAGEKAFEFYGSPLDEQFNDFIEQYVNEESLESSDDSKELDFAIDFDNIFELGTSSSSSLSISPHARHNAQSPEPWRKGLWCLNPPAALPAFDPEHGAQAQTAGGQGLVSPSSIEALSLVDMHGLPNFDLDLNLLPTPLPSTPPTTPPRKTTGKSVTAPKTIRRRHPNGQRGSHRRSSMSPTLISQLAKSDVSLDEWAAQRFSNINLRVPDESLPLSPPPSSKIMQHDPPLNTPIMQTHDGGQMSFVNPPHRPHLYIPSPTTHSMQNQTSHLAHGLPTSASLTLHSAACISEPLLTLPHATGLSHPQPLQPWHSAPLDSTDFGYGASPDLQSVQAQAWWSPAGPASAVQPCGPHMQGPGYYHLAQPTPQRPTHSLIHANSASSFGSAAGGESLMQSNGGLMIHYGAATDHGANAPSSRFPSALSPILTDSSLYPPLPNANDAFSHTSPFTPRRRRQPSPPSRSPSLSPTNAARTNGTIATTPHGSLRASRRQSHGRRSRSAATTPKTPCASSFSNVDFVNFTPSDSRKILTGVAPSGSSKTKARREQEAKEKRRKMSEAAMRAVRNGDVEALEAVLC